MMPATGNDRVLRRKFRLFGRIVCVLSLIFLFPLKSSGSAQAGAGNQQPNQATLFLVADGSPGWYTNTVGSALELLKREVPHNFLQIAVFDKEPNYTRDAELMRAEKPAPLLPPRTPLREAMEACFESLVSIPTETIGAMVVIVQEESYPSLIPSGHLSESAAKSGLKIYTISLASRNSNERAGMLSRLGRGFVDAIAWTFSGLVDDPGPSSRGTSHMLENLSDSSGGNHCHAADESAAMGCADEIAAEIRRIIRRGAPNRP
jgi:hypothetical protein